MNEFLDNYLLVTSVFIIFFEIIIALERIEPEEKIKKMMSTFIIVLFWPLTLIYVLFCIIIVRNERK